MISLQDLRLVLLLPRYDGRCRNSLAIWNLSREVPGALYVEYSSSALCMTFNNLLGEAIAARARGYTHALWLHDDIQITDERWFSVLWREYEKHDAQIISAVSPVKDARGLTSTARDCGTSKYAPRRLTMHEVMDLPVTFTFNDILLNTGVMLHGLNEPWLNGMVFTTDNAMTVENGKLVGAFESEDWRWSRDARGRGCTRQYATRAVKLLHCGAQEYPNDQAWGQKTDEAFVAAGR